MKNMLLSLICAKIFGAFRFTVMSLQQLLLKFLGKTSDQPERWAKVMRVLLRYKQNSFALASKDDFLGLHESFQSPEYVLHQDVSLYNIDAETVTFVQLPPGTETYEPLGQVPYYLQQYRHAIKVIEMPLETFCRLAWNSIPKPRGPVVTLVNAPKCGCSVLAEAVHMTGGVTVLWEPDAFTSLSLLKLDNRARVLRSAFHYICRGGTTSNGQGYFIKLRSVVSALIECIHQETPWIRQVFAYGSPLGQIWSSMSAFKGSDLQVAVESSDFYRRKVINILFKQHGSTEALEKHCNSFFTLMFGLRTQALTQYLKARKEGVPIVAIKYESLLYDFEKVFGEMVNFCGLTKRPLPPKCLITLKSRLQTLEDMRAVSKEIYQKEYNSQSKVDVDAMAETFRVPRIDSEGTLDGTL